MRCVIDRQLFIRRVGIEWLIAAILVDDSLFFACNAALMDAFMATWLKRFNSSITAQRANMITYGGINYTRRDLTVEASCERLVEDLAKLIRAHRYIVVTDAPMTVEAFAKIRQEAACESAELVVVGPAAVRTAQVILGLGGWITANKSLEATFAYTVLATRVTHCLADTVESAAALGQLPRVLERHPPDFPRRRKRAGLPRLRGRAERHRGRCGLFRPQCGRGKKLRGIRFLSRERSR